MTIPNTPSPPAHTAGKVRLCGGYTPAYTAIVSEDGHGYLVFRMADYAEDRERDKPIKAPSYEEHRANARRLVALWNSCIGLPTEALEAGVMERLIETTKALRAATMELALAARCVDALDLIGEVDATLALVDGQEGKTDA